MAEFLAPEVVFEWGGVMPDFVNRREFLAFYRLAWSHFDEHIVARVTAVGEDTLTAWLDNTLNVSVDWLDCPIQPFHAGQHVQIDGTFTIASLTGVSYTSLRTSDGLPVRA